MKTETTIPDHGLMKTTTIDRAKRRRNIELKSAVVKVSDLIQRLSKGGYGFLSKSNGEVTVILKECPFITWNMIVKVFKDAGYSAVGEIAMIVWADASELKDDA
jgi:hypothetical protein